MSVEILLAPRARGLPANVAQKREPTEEQYRHTREMQASARTYLHSINPKQSKQSRIVPDLGRGEGGLKRGRPAGEKGSVCV